MCMNKLKLTTVHFQKITHLLEVTKSEIKRQANMFFLWQYQIVKQIFSHIPILHIKPTKP